VVILVGWLLLRLYGAELAVSNCVQLVDLALTADPRPANVLLCRCVALVASFVAPVVASAIASASTILQWRGGALMVVVVASFVAPVVASAIASASTILQWRSGALMVIVVASFIAPVVASAVTTAVTTVVGGEIVHLISRARRKGALALAWALGSVAVSFAPLVASVRARFSQRAPRAND
jgi:hypothetical protein